jgi:hypothetical protein
VLEGSTAGLDTTTGTYVGQIIGNWISGAANSIKHNSGNKFRYIGNHLDDGTGVYKAPTIVAGIFVGINANATTNSVQGALAKTTILVTRSVSGSPIGIGADQGDELIITVDTAATTTLTAPVSPTTGQRLTVTIRNTSGVAMGAITWDAVFKMTAFINPATGFSRSIEFRYDGANWVEIGRAAADVPN